MISLGGLPCSVGKRRGGIDGGRNWEDRREKNCGQDVMDERINKRIYKARSLIIQTTPNFCLALIMRTKNEERSISICINSN